MSIVLVRSWQPDGSFFVSLNLGLDSAWWHPESLVPWRGWALHINEDGRMEPWATGMRSPCGFSHDRR